MRRSGRQQLREEERCRGKKMWKKRWATLGRGARVTPHQGTTIRPPPQRHCKGMDYKGAVRGQS